MGLMRVSEREYWAEVAKRPAMFLGSDHAHRPRGVPAGGTTIIRGAMVDRVWMAGTTGW
jgi:hypothetical protein